LYLALNTHVNTNQEIFSDFNKEYVDIYVIGLKEKFINIQ